MLANCSHHCEIHTTAKIPDILTNLRQYHVSAMHIAIGWASEVNFPIIDMDAMISRDTVLY